MNDVSMIDKAENLSRRRARMLPVIAVIYLAQQATFLSGETVEPLRSVDHVKIGAWLLLSFVILLAVSTNGFWFKSRELRALIDDENTRANRARGMSAGFVAAMLGGMLLYALQPVVQFSVREVIHLILSLGLGVALIRYGTLERRALRDA